MAKPTSYRQQQGVRPFWSRLLQEDVFVVTGNTARTHYNALTGK
jgi:hypothetical protein